MLARHGRRLLNLLDDTPVVPGDRRPRFEHAHQAHQILTDAEEDLHYWRPSLEPVPTAAARLGTNAVPSEAATSVVGQEEYPTNRPVENRHAAGDTGLLESVERRDAPGSYIEAPTEPAVGHHQQV